MKRFGLLCSLSVVLFLNGCDKLPSSAQAPKSSLEQARSLAKINGYPYITWQTYYNTHHEWGVDVTAHYWDEGTFSYNIRWFVKAQFSNYQWIEYTGTGPIHQYLTVEQLYGYNIQVYCIQQFFDGEYLQAEEASDVYTISYIEP